MNACRDLEPLLSLHAAGALDRDEAARVEAHLAGCPACRAEAAADAELLGLARLPPPTERERRAVEDLPARTVAAFRRTEARRGFAKRLGTAFAVAAAAVLVLAAPALLRSSGPRVAPVPAEAVAWQEPDLDDLWDDSAVLDLDAAAYQGVDGATAAMAAVDAGDGG